MIILRAGLIRAYNLAISITFSNTLIMFIVFTAFTAVGGTLTPRRVFTTLSLIVAIRRSMLFLFVRGIFQLSERKVADNRIQVRLISHGSKLATPTLHMAMFTKVVGLGLVFGLENKERTKGTTNPLMANLDITRLG